MRIVIESPEERNFCISLPTWLVVNRVTAGVALAILREKTKPLELNIDWEDLSRFLKTFRKVKHQYGGWCLIDAESSDGEKVQIWL